MTAVHEHIRPACFPDIETMVSSEMDATPLRDRLDHAQRDQILTASHRVLGQFVREGRLVLPLSGYVIVAESV